MVHLDAPDRLARLLLTEWTGHSPRGYADSPTTVLRAYVPVRVDVNTDAIPGRAGDPGRWHDMRHEGACRLLADGVDIRIIQLMLGHASFQQTLLGGSMIA
jgi:integrase